MAKKKGRPAKKEAKEPKNLKTKPEKKALTNPQPRQKSLPGMQDRRVVALENAALKYADIRDERMGWTKQEVEAKKKVQDLMHEQNRTHYERGNIEIDLVPENEHVRVRVRDREQPIDEPVEGEPLTIDEPSPDESSVEEPDPDEVYDSRVSDSPVRDPKPNSDF